MKKEIRIANYVALLSAVLTLAGCKDDPVAPPLRNLYVEVKGDTPFYLEGSWDGYEGKFVADSTYFHSDYGLIFWNRLGYPAKGSTFRVYVRSQASDGYVSVEAQIHTGAREFGNVAVLFHEKKESRGKPVEVTCIVP